jgi:hypothetical protein
MPPTTRRRCAPPEEAGTTGALPCLLAMFTSAGQGNASSFPGLLHGTTLRKLAPAGPLLFQIPGRHTSREADQAFDPAAALLDDIAQVLGLAQPGEAPAPHATGVRRPQSRSNRQSGRDHAHHVAPVRCRGQVRLSVTFILIYGKERSPIRWPTENGRR